MTALRTNLSYFLSWLGSRLIYLAGRVNPNSIGMNDDLKPIVNEELRP